ncbi:MAG: PEP-CTERM sorting domain-containing protein [Acidobacteriota bacterium]
MQKFLFSLILGAALSLTLAKPAEATLTVFQTFTGNVGYSMDGFGSTSNSGTISASVPAGATVLAAYLYTSTFAFSQPPATPGGTLNGSAVSYGPLVGYVPIPSIPSFSLQSARADVTSIVAPIINAGPGGTYNFTVTETSSFQDGEVLVVVYELPSLPVATVGILDGFSTSGGDTTSISFADPLDPSDPSFFAEMALAIGFSAGGTQFSTVAVNGTTITNVAGGFDDGALANGALITAGGFDDPFSPFLPSGSQDHERYNLAPYITLGDTSISIQTSNPSLDDNIFLATFFVRGEGFINEPPPPTSEVPEPYTLTLLGCGLLFFGAHLRKRT